MAQKEFHEFEKIPFEYEQYIFDKLIPQQWSGRYVYTNSKFIFAERQLRVRDFELEKFRLVKNPVYAIEEPIYRADKYIKKYHWPTLSIVLHIDIDATDPMDIVSGTIRKTSLFSITQQKIHFIGQVTSKAVTGFNSIDLVVENFTFDWPNTSNTIDRIEITLNNKSNPTAIVNFSGTGLASGYGPYTINRESRYFHEIELEIDREDNIQEVEPYNTHTHPDRPADLVEENLTIASAYAKAGIKITSSTEGNIIDTTGTAGVNGWTEQELHDLMEAHWSDFENKPQWKMWLFLGENAEDPDLAGVMFDGYIDEPGGVDRQGAAVLTQTEWMFSATGDLPPDNPPAAEAILRELFLVSVHEMGHAFNLAHPNQKTVVTEWIPPAWADQPVNDQQALTWMNYSWLADTDVDYSADWFYDRFYFRFIPYELTFLRHAPDQHVRMGDDEFGDNHAVAFGEKIDGSLELLIRTRKPILEFGEPAFIELRLKNTGKRSKNVHNLLNPKNGFVQIAITNPDGKRVACIAPMHADRKPHIKELKPGEALYESVQITVGKKGFHFKKPGAYRIEACYNNFDGKQSAGVMQLWIKPPKSFDDHKVFAELYDARIARTLYMGGTRYMEDVNEKLDWVCKKLPQKHPAQYYLNACRALPFAKPFNTIQNKKRIVLDADPEFTVKKLQPIIDNMADATETLGHIPSRNLVNVYTSCALKAKNKKAAREANTNLFNIYKKRKVVDAVLFELDEVVKTMK